MRAITAADVHHAIAEEHAELARVKAALRRLYLAPVTLSSLQDVLRLAEELNPGIREELQLARQTTANRLPC